MSVPGFADDVRTGPAERVLTYCVGIAASSVDTVLTRPGSKFYCQGPDFITELVVGGRTDVNGKSTGVREGYGHHPADITPS